MDDDKTMEFGREMLKLKLSTPHGEFHKRLAELGITPRRANYAMRLASGKTITPRRRRKSHRRLIAEFLANRDGGFACYWCAKPLGGGEPFHFDHHEPLSKGGEDSIENLVLSCPQCNRPDRALPDGTG